jgi:hypothetical protein
LRTKKKTDEHDDTPKDEKGGRHMRRAA